MNYRKASLCEGGTQKGRRERDLSIPKAYIYKKIVPHPEVWYKHII